jgi:hypothetical protein
MEDRKSKGTAVVSLDWLVNQFLSGKVNAGRGPWRWTPADEESLQRLKTLHHEWEELSKDGPPSLPDYVAFMTEFVPVYNAFHNRLKKGLCVKCWAFYTFTAQKRGKFCSTDCANAAKQRTKGQRLKALLQRIELHQRDCAQCQQKRPCVELKAFKGRLGRWYKKTADDAMNLRDYGGAALDIALEQTARTEVETSED